MCTTGRASLWGSQDVEGKVLATTSISPECGQDAEIRCLSTIWRSSESRCCSRQVNSHEFGRELTRQVVYSSMEHSRMEVCWRSSMSSRIRLLVPESSDVRRGLYVSSPVVALSTPCQVRSSVERRSCL